MTSSCSPLATPTATRAVLERHGFSLKKSLGQNFLVNDDIVRKIIQLAEVGPDDVVLEIGPGIGTLTWALLANAKAVVSIERDETLPPVLVDTLSEFDERFVLINKDALEVTKGDIATMGVEPNKLVSNLPYAVAATVVLDYFQRFSSLESMTVMVQREVADRMCAKTGTKNYGAYTVKLSMYAEPAGSFKVAPSNFMPPPHVESAVLRLDRREAFEPPELIDVACEMADAAFFARRKTIANSCKQYFASRNPKVASEIVAILEAAGIDPKTRGEKLTREDYLNLGQKLLTLH